MQRPAGRTILTGLAWSAGLVPRSMAEGMIRLHPSASNTVGGVLAIILEPERPPPEALEAYGSGGRGCHQRICPADLASYGRRPYSQSSSFRVCSGWRSLPSWPVQDHGLWPEY
jgi:hypothetical protein